MNSWHDEFRMRMNSFASTKVQKYHVPVSIKIRVDGGCFHRSCSPQAYKDIDKALLPSRSNSAIQFEEHESGPELLVYAAITTAGLTLTAALINLVTAIIKARYDGIKKGDRPREPLELIIRGHWRDGEYIEEKILKIPSDTSPNIQQIETLLQKALQKQNAIEGTVENTSPTQDQDAS